MSTTTRRVLVSIAVLILVGCLCLSGLTIAGAGVGYYQLNRPASPTPTLRPAIRTPQPQTSPTPQLPGDEPGQASPTPDAGLPSGVVRQMEMIEDQVAEIRGLAAQRVVPRFLLGAEQLRERVEQDFFKDYTVQDAQDDAQVMAALGLLPQGYDLFSMFVDLYSESVAGFYDQDEKVMYIVQGMGFLAAERLTYSHEFTHALQDQVYDIKNGLRFNEEACDGQAERCAGVQALIEGDASMVEQRWLTDYATQQDLLDLQAMVTEAQTPIFDQAPAFLQQDLLFPYIKGLEFVESLYDRGGWQAIDAAYLAPPVSTEQILHPDLYPADEPQSVALPNLGSALGAGWRLIEDESLGEWYTFLMLAYGSEAAQRLPESDARQAAAGWDGDQLMVYARESDLATVLALETRWDDPEQAEEFCEYFAQYAHNRWGDAAELSDTLLEWSGDGQVSRLLRLENRTIWLSAPDAQTVSDLTGLFPTS